jgi:hypothetical protein
MKKKLTAVTISLAFCAVYSVAWADAFYCTQTNQYISQGMSTDAVEQACGAPQNIQKTSQPITQRIPVTQLTFNISTSTSGQLQGTVTPGLYSSNFQINNGPVTTLVVESSNNQITDISINGTPAQSVSICNGATFGVGDPPVLAINSCGDPAYQNNTYKNVNTGQNEPVQIWSYKPTTYQQPFNLVFVNGSLAQVETNAGQQ